MHLLTNYLEYSSICSAFLRMHGGRKLCTLLFSKHQHVEFSLTAQDAIMPYTQSIQSKGVRGCWKQVPTFPHEKVWVVSTPVSISVKRSALCIFVNQGYVSTYHKNHV